MRKCSTIRGRPSPSPRPSDRSPDVSGAGRGSSFSQRIREAEAFGLVATLDAVLPRPAGQGRGENSAKSNFALWTCEFTKDEWSAGLKDGPAGLSGTGCGYVPDSRAPQRQVHGEPRPPTLDAPWDHERSSARERLGLRPSSGAFRSARPAQAKAPEDWRSPKPGGPAEIHGKLRRPTLDAPWAHERPSARERLGLRPSSGAFRSARPAQAKAPEDWRSPKPGGPAEIHGKGEVLRSDAA